MIVRTTKAFTFPDKPNLGDLVDLVNNYRLGSVMREYELDIYAPGKKFVIPGKEDFWVVTLTSEEEREWYA